MPQATSGGIYVIVPTHERKEHLRRCLTALADQTEPHTVVVVDDGSTDGTREMLASDFPRVVVLAGDGSLWWTGSVNRGVAWVLARAARAEACVTLNDDTLPPPLWLATLSEAARRHRPALVGSVTLDAADGSVLEAETIVNWWTAKFVYPRRGDTLAPSDTGCVPSDALNGRGTYIPLAAFVELGPYAQGLPQYGADYEFSIRAARRGRRLLVCRAAALPTDTATSGLDQNSSGTVLALVDVLWSRRSATSLPYRLRFALLACPRGSLPSFLVLDSARVLAGSVRRWLRRRRQPAGGRS